MLIMAQCTIHTADHHCSWECPMQKFSGRGSYRPSRLVHPSSHPSRQPYEARRSSPVSLLPPWSIHRTHACRYLDSSRCRNRTKKSCGGSRAASELTRPSLPAADPPHVEHSSTAVPDDALQSPIHLRPWVAAVVWWLHGHSPRAGQRLHNAALSTRLSTRCPNTIHAPPTLVTLR